MSLDTLARFVQRASVPVAAAIGLAAALSASAGFVPGRDFIVPSVDLKRRGLTNEQYGKLAAARREMGRPLVMNPNDAVEMIYRAERGKNIEEWIGETTGEPELGRKIADTVETNRVLVADNRRLSTRVAYLEAYSAELYGEVTNLSAQVELYRGRYEETKPSAALAIRIQDALRAEGTLGPKLRADLVGMRDSTDDPRKREVYDSCIALVDSVVNVVRDSDM